MATFSFDDGTVTSCLRAPLALRIAVRKSAIGSVCIFQNPHPGGPPLWKIPRQAGLLPRTLGDAGNQPAMAHAAKADTADAEAAHVATGATAQIAAVVNTRLEFRLLLEPLALGDLTRLSHVPV